ncbi:GNAT family N-acetyltransferase [Pseudomonas mosselii]|uniref:GNAT family N-acetyltransferase n=1 Tax=unclassified Pseudomonas TaxID=196821 RepID=UPI0020C58A77|nr:MULTISPECIES: GNAT family N-acetyltransferase [unclassified Pseudomonas]MCP8633507.1 GNAT family N-acetyltransferase [Pseudomonas sp. DVZ6]MDC0690990.1 GNAT family N-acetyltransferase [Mitsuaria sp. RG]MDD7784355.1 GNAT family N-acetyltransferase [Pseudomonas sp. DVZ24]
MAQVKPKEDLLRIIGRIASEPSSSGEPFFVFDLDASLENAAAFQDAARREFEKVSLRASIKSCNVGLFCERLRQLGYGAEVCSLEELGLVERAGFSSSDIIFDGPLKTDEELGYCIDNDVLVQIDGLGELERVCEIAQARLKKVDVLVRLTHLYKDQGYSRFGMSGSEFTAEAAPLLKDCSFVELKGFHFNFGSNLSSHLPIVEGLSHWVELLNTWMPENGVLDLGSGFPADSFSDDPGTSTPDAAQFFSGIKSYLLDKFGIKANAWTYLFEPGRVLSEDFGYLVGRVVDSKWRNGIEILQSNLAVNWVGSMRSWHHLVAPLDHARPPARATQYIAGFNCFEQDYLTAIGSEFSLKAGDWFYIRGCGAYDLQTMTEWVRRRPVVLAVVNGDVEVARPRGLTNGLCSDDLYLAYESIDVNEDISLLQARPRFADKLYPIIDRNRQGFSEAMHWPRYSTSLKSVQDFLLQSQLEHQKGASKTYVVHFRGEPCGMLSFHEIDSSNKTAYIGYWLDPDRRGCGIITQALQALISHYADGGDIQRFVIKVSVHNGPSNRVAQRCGFALEGTLKRSERIGDRYVDQNIYGRVVE